MTNGPTHINYETDAVLISAQVIRDLELLPLLGGQTFTAVFLQRFEGTVTIWPHSRFGDWFNILTDPDRKELARMMNVGKRVTWPKVISPF